MVSFFVLASQLSHGWPPAAISVCICVSRKMEVEGDKSFPSIVAVYFCTGTSETQLGSFLLSVHLIRLC